VTGNGEYPVNGLPPVRSVHCLVPEIGELGLLGDHPVERLDSERPKVGGEDRQGLVGAYWTRSATSSTTA
jgi:hypothetical protein